MKVLQVNCVYGTGSTGKIVKLLHDKLIKNGHSSIVLYGRAGVDTDINTIKISTEFEAKLHSVLMRLFGLEFCYSIVSTIRLIRRIKEEKPDIVHLHCINGNFVNIYKLLSFLKTNKCSTVITHHAEFFYTGNCAHAYDCIKYLTGCGKCPNLKEATNSLFFDRTRCSWNKFKKVFSGFDMVRMVGVSEWVSERGELSPLMNGHQFHTVYNGVETEDTFYPKDCRNLRSKLSINNEFIIVHVTALFEDTYTSRKGGQYVIEIAKKLIDVDVKIIVIGPYKVSNRLPDNLYCVGKINNQNELADYYTLADVCLLTSRRETYSMICAESLSCGTPVIGFKAGGPENIALEAYSKFVDYGDTDEIVKYIKNLIAKEYDKPKLTIANEAKIKYSKSAMYEKYMDIYKSFDSNHI